MAVIKPAMTKPDLQRYPAAIEVSFGKRDDAE
jgi:hypothetical protein